MSLGIMWGRMLRLIAATFGPTFLGCVILFHCSIYARCGGPEPRLYNTTIP